MSVSLPYLFYGTWAYGVPIKLTLRCSIPTMTFGVVFNPSFELPNSAVCLYQGLSMMDSTC